MPGQRTCRNDRRYEGVSKPPQPRAGPQQQRDGGLHRSQRVDGGGGYASPQSVVKAVANPDADLHQQHAATRAAQRPADEADRTQRARRPRPPDCSTPRSASRVLRVGATPAKRLPRTTCSMSPRVMPISLSMCSLRLRARQRPERISRSRPSASLIRETHGDGRLDPARPRTRSWLTE